MKMLSPHFSQEECECRCCGQCNVSPRLLNLAEKIREYFGGRPMITHSVCRCKKKNDEVKGVKNSQHLYGRAMDFHIRGLAHELVYNQLKSVHNEYFPELRGLFLYDWGIHIDVRNDTFRCKDYRKEAAKK